MDTQLNGATAAVAEKQARARKGKPFGTLPCPFCGHEEAAISLDLAEGGMTCAECDAEFTVDDVREIITKWQRVLSWIDTMPG